METISNENPEQSAWNLSQAIIQQLSALLQRASSLYSTGNIQSSYFVTQEMLILIHSDLNAQEIKNLEASEKEISKLYMAWKALHRKKEDEELDEAEEKTYVQNRNIHAKRVKEYRLYTIDLLAKYGYMPSKREDSSKLM